MGGGGGWPGVGKCCRALVHICVVTPSEDWVNGAVGRIKLAMGGDWEQLSSSAIESSQQLNWENISKKLIQFIEKIAHN